MSSQPSPPPADRTTRGWTESILETVRAAWCVQGLTASGIVALLSRYHHFKTTRNAVLGQANRRGWRRAGGRRRGPPADAPCRIAPALQKKAFLREKASLLEKTELQKTEASFTPGDRGAGWEERFPVPLTSVDMLGLKAGHCRWPVGRGAGTAQKFCGAVTAGSKPYCPGHALSAYAPARPQPLRAPHEAASRRRAVDGDRAADLVEVFT